MWEVRLSVSFVKELAFLERSGQSRYVERIQSALHRLEEDPVRARVGLDLRRLEGAPRGTMRLRVGPFRVIYEVDPDRRLVNVTVVARRGPAYS